MKSTLQIITGLVIFIVLSYLLWIYFWSSDLSNELSDFGQFYSGTIGVIFAIVASIIAYTTYRQQVKVSQYQNFETTFFKMLEMTENNVRTMDITFKSSSDRTDLVGRKSFERIYRELLIRFNQIFNKENTTSEFFELSEKEKLNRELEIIQEAYDEFSKEFLISVGPYLRHLFYLINYIDEQTFLDFKQKRFYINMIRTQLSAYELIILFYACLSKRGYKKFKPLIEKYGILSHIKHIEDKLFQAYHIRLFNEGAFIEPS